MQRTPEHICKFTEKVAFFYTGGYEAYLVMECHFKMDDGSLCCKTEVFTGKAYQVG